MLLLQKNRQISNGYVIRAPRTGEFWSQATFVRRWKLLQAALLNAARGIESNGAGSILTPHYFRHNYASILYRSGVDVLTAQRFLGHTDPTTTMRIYTHLEYVALNLTLASARLDSSDGEVRHPRRMD